ncbi:MAG: NAD-dependent epimerase/dehydratase family protein [Dehalococcoidia bacterium]
MKVVVIGGCGFVGSNLAEHFLGKGSRVTAFDDLSRPGGGARKNLETLRLRHSGSSLFEFVWGDVRVFDQVARVVDGADLILHVAAQTALTTSIEDPVADFEVNARGTLNVLEAARQQGQSPVLLYTSSTAVYGDLTRWPIRVREEPARWAIADPRFEDGIDEEYPLDRGGPYGCSKATGDLYCLDYARTFGLRTVVFRLSAVYGPGQHGTEDQGWVSWFLQRATQRRPVTIFGDGKQVRDVLFVTDLVAAVELAISNIGRTTGQAYNIGGGKEFSLSILELLRLMENDLRIAPSSVAFDEWRPADCPALYLDTTKAREDFAWTPKVPPGEGVRKTYQWLESIL